MLNISAKLRNSYLMSQDDHVKLARCNSMPVDCVRPFSSKKLVRQTSNEEEDSELRLKRMLATNIEKYNHLLVAKVKDTSIMFSFFVEASIIDVVPGQGGSSPQ